MQAHSTGLLDSYLRRETPRSRPSQDRIAGVLAEKGSATRAEIAEELGTTYWGTRDVLNRMEADGTVVGERIRGRGNERHFRLVVEQ